MVMQLLSSRVMYFNPGNPLLRFFLVHSHTLISHLFSVPNSSMHVLLEAGCGEVWS